VGGDRGGKPATTRADDDNVELCTHRDAFVVRAINGVV
jgi:hypothetical protein